VAVAVMSGWGGSDSEYAREEVTAVGAQVRVRRASVV